MRRKINGYIILLFSLVLLFSCDKEEGDGHDTDPSTRTVLVYLGRDNDLSRVSEDKIAPILSGWDGKYGKVIIYEDLSGELPRLMEVYRENGENKLKTVYQAGSDENSASGTVLSRVINETRTLYPARSYGLIVFSHGWGWLPSGGFTSPYSRSIIKDNDTEMNIREFADALPDNMLDFIVFEACYMASVEVAYELKDKTKYILASSAEIVSPGFKNVYTKAINSLLQKDADLITFARNAFELFNASYGGTISVIRTSGLTELAGYLKTNISREKSIESVEEVQNFDRNSNKLFFDFHDHYSRLMKTGTEAGLSSALEECILYEQASSQFMIHYNGFLVDKHCGMTSYILQEKYDYLNEEYGKLKWYNAVYN